MAGTGGDGASFQTESVNGVITGSFPRNQDRAYVLASVSEPASLLLIVAALAALASVRRRALNAPERAT